MSCAVYFIFGKSITKKPRAKKATRVKRHRTLTPKFGSEKLHKGRKGSRKSKGSKGSKGRKGSRKSKGSKKSKHCRHSKHPKFGSTSNAISLAQGYTGLAPTQAFDHYQDIPESIRSNFYTDVNPMSFSFPSLGKKQ
jgi:hypothetical protein